MPGRDQKGVSLLDTNTVSLHFTDESSFIYKDVDVTVSVVVLGSAFI